MGRRRASVEPWPNFELTPRNPRTALKNGGLTYAKFRPFPPCWGISGTSGPPRCRTPFVESRDPESRAPIDPELEALPEPRRPLRRLTLATMSVTAVLALVAAVGLRSSAA